MAAVIIPQWRIPKSEPEPSVNPYTVPLSLTLMFVVVLLLDRACTLLCALETLYPGNFLLHTVRKGGFLHLPSWSGKLARVVTYVGSSKFVTV